MGIPNREPHEYSRNVVGISGHRYSVFLHIPISLLGVPIMVP